MMSKASVLGTCMLLGLTALATAPIPFIGVAPTVILGLPIWLWWSIVLTLVLGVLSTWGILRYWKDDDAD